MKVTQEKLPKSQIGLSIEITPEVTKQRYEQVVKNLASSANIPGFRKGKVPRQILLQRYGMNRIKAAALEEIIQDGIEKALKQEEIQAIGQPQLRSQFEELVNNYEPGKPLTFSAAIDVEPVTHLNQYKDFIVKAEEVEYDKEQVDKVLENERQQMATLIPVEGRQAQIGDIAVVDFKGVFAPSPGDDETAPPRAIPGAQAKDFQVELLEDKFIPGFVTGIVGMNAGETKEISAQFPDPYQNPELAGTHAIFTVTLHELKEKELPELNDDFAQEVSEYETLEELRRSLEERFEKEAQDKTKANKHQAVIAELLKHVSVDLPETMIKQEVETMLRQTLFRLSQQGVDVKKLFSPEMIPQWQERSRGEAVERLRQSLALMEVSKLESISVTDEEIQARVQELMQQYSERDIDPENLAIAVENEMLTERILDWLVEHSSVELVPEGTLRAEVAATEIEAASPTEQIIEESTDSPIDVEATVITSGEETTPTAKEASGDNPPSEG
ncbi:trigger factor [Iningainema tapete]|uniref:Trigger factor n=1 Tax=Iningainema tapete BLCC-T55 TaxID=2748662 RepID=A0A8J7C6P0_9CYAN|nr:trigger factor [Iningainema tapete]MBD2774584.1 trigger factor [Iningainema tapete BLCC-T55]